MIEIKRYHPELFETWNQFIHSAKNGLFFFNRNYLSYHEDRFKDHSLLFYKKDQLIAVLPASEKEKTISSHGGLTFGGLIMDPAIRAEEVLEIFESFKGYYKSEGFEVIIYKAIPHIFNTLPAEEDLYALFRSNAQIVTRNISSILNLKNPIRFSETKRQNVRKCEKAEVTVQETAELEDFWNLLLEVLKKHNASPVHNLEEITRLVSRFPNNIKLFTATQENELLAGIVMFDFGNVVHTQYMGASDKGRKLGALDYINHYLIQSVYNNRNYFSFGTSNEQAGLYLNLGLILQKEMMGGRGIVYDTYQINL